MLRWLRNRQKTPRARAAHQPRETFCPAGRRRRTSRQLEAAARVRPGRVISGFPLSERGIAGRIAGRNAAGAPSPRCALDAEVTADMQTGAPLAIETAARNLVRY